MKKNFIPSILLFLFLCVCARAQISQFGQATYLTVTTNAGPIAQQTFQVYVPSISLTITATNVNTVITNTLNHTVSLGGTNYFTIANTFIYSAATMGTNFSTNFPAAFYVGTDYVWAQAAPMLAGGSNVYIK